MRNLLDWFMGLEKRGKMIVVAGTALALILIIELLR